MPTPWRTGGVAENRPLEGRLQKPNWKECLESLYTQWRIQKMIHITPLLRAYSKQFSFKKNPIFIQLMATTLAFYPRGIFEIPPDTPGITPAARNLHYCHPLYTIVTPFGSNTKRVLEGSGEFRRVTPFIIGRLSLHSLREGLWTVSSFNVFVFLITGYGWSIMVNKMEIALSFWSWI